MDRAFDRLCIWCARRLGNPRTFVVASVICALAFAAGLVPAWGDTVNPLGGAVTGYVGVLLLLILQNTSNREAAAAQAKADEIVRALPGARDDLIGAEALSAEEIAALRNR